jgi:uncharacterized protein (DUF58 family)
MFRKIGAFFISLKQGKYLYVAITINILLFIMAYIFPALGIMATIYFVLLVITLIVDLGLLYFAGTAIESERIIPNRLSNGDLNNVKLNIQNNYNFPIHATVIEELPKEFQVQDFYIKTKIDKAASKTISYKLKPISRGSYNFGHTLIFVQSFLRIWERRYALEQPKQIPTYPAYIHLKQYHLMAVANRLSEIGVKKTRKIGASSEFEQIKEYVQGDDYRTVNWKATARKGSLMVNKFTDEKSQLVYCIINKSRVMRMPFEGLSLLDYSINASLVLSHVVVTRQDRVGLITFAEKTDTFIPATKKTGTMHLIQEALYNQSTGFLEADYERLFLQIRNNITQRSLLVLFTNFETLQALQRDLPTLRKINKYHLLLVVLFENTEVQDMGNETSTNLESVYEKAIAEKYILEKKLIAKELNKYGILTILTKPKNLTINAINKYVELKNKAFI